MPQASAIAACFSDWRTVKGRKSLQLIFEVPLEQQGAVLEYLGAPMPDTQKWVGIALLKGEPKAEPAEQPKSPGQRALTRAAILCDDKQFQSYMGAKDSDECAALLRNFLRVSSRREIASDPGVLQAFISLELEFQMATGRAAADPRA